MTDREPDDLYDALRDRLTDFGQEPPAPLWASIRAQLPPPVAAPQRQRRVRRRALAALALLLLVGLGTWQGWQAGKRRTTRTGRLATRVAGPAARQPGPQRPAAKQLPTATPPTHQSRQASADAPGPAVVAAAGTFAGASVGASTKPAAAAAGVATAPAAFVQPPRSRDYAATHATSFGERTAGRAAGTQAGGPRAAPSTATLAPTVARPAVARATPRAAPLLASTRGISTGSESTAPAAARPETTTDSRQQPIHAPAEILAETGREPPQPAAWKAPALALPVPPRVAALLLTPHQTPALLARADTLPPLPAATTRRWAVQALAGPALTWRTLGPGPLADAPAPGTTSFPNTSPPRNMPGTSPAENEQAATGFGAELQLQRQLNGRWSLGSGVGYHAFATNQTVPVRVVQGLFLFDRFPPDSGGTTATVRNTYHFLTLPLRVSYQLGTGRGRLRYGLRAGADVALYLGGRSTEDWATAGGASTSPYRPLSLALGLGAEVRYRFAPGWEVLAQPTLTHFVTSVARPSSGYVPRYPVAATALVGVAYWLR